MIHIIGFGNPFHGDDGFGPEVIRNLRDKQPPPEVSLFDGGILGLDAVKLFENCEEVIVVDAARGKTPGGVDWISTQAITGNDVALNLTTHGFGVGKLMEVLPIALKGKKIPKIRFLAGWVGEIKVFRDGLSETARSSVERAVDMILEDAVWQTSTPTP